MHPLTLAAIVTLGDQDSADTLIPPVSNSRPREQGDCAVSASACSVTGEG